jgi:outer membrane receptor protein involved in Fe transport
MIITSHMTAFRACAFAGALFFLMASVTNSQTVVSSPTNNTDTDDEIVVMSVFSVSTEKDSGYTATDTLSGSRLSINLLKSPADVSVLTREFMDDIGILDTQDAHRWLTSAYPTNLTTDPRDGGGGSDFRGLLAGPNTRNYFPYPITVYDYVIERMEAWRGPNAILYGVGPAGGSINLVTKKPMFRNRTVLELRGSSEGTGRVTIDSDWKVSRRLGMRVNAIMQNRRNWMDRYYDDLRGADIAVAMRPWHGAIIRIEGEVTRRKNTMTYVPILDGTSLWDQSTTFTGALSSGAPAGSGVARFGANYLVASNIFDGLLNYGNFGRTSGTNLPTAYNDDRTDIDRSNFPLIPRQSFWAQPLGARQINESYAAQLFYEQQFHFGLVTEIAFSLGHTDREGPWHYWMSTFVDIHSELPNGLPNPYFKKYYTETTLNNFYWQANERSTMRAAAAYPITFGNNTQSFGVVVQQEFGSWNRTADYLVRTNGSSTNLRDGSNSIMYRQYWDAPLDNMKMPVSVGDYELGYITNIKTDQADRMASAQINTIGKYFNNALTMVAGVRYDGYKTHTSNIATRSATGHAATYSDTPDTSYVTTYNIGVTYFPIEPIGIYANYTEGFRPITGAVLPLPGYATVAATSSLAKTIGIRFSLFNNRLIGSAGYYTSAEKNQVGGIPNSAVNNIWTNMDLALQGAGYALRMLPVGNNSDTYDYEGSGFELDMTANITKRIRLKFNIAVPKTEQSNMYPANNAYYTQNSPEWQAFINNTTIAEVYRNAVRTNMQTYWNNIIGENGRTLNGTVKWSSSIFVNYIFNSGPLKGLSLGTGANLYGKRVIGNEYGRAMDYVYAESYHIMTAMAAYNTKIGKIPVTFQLNVSNLLDYADPIFTGVTVYNSKAYRGMYYYIPGREATLTIRFTF